MQLVKYDKSCGDLKRAGWIWRKEKQKNLLDKYVVMIKNVKINTYGSKKKKVE